MTITEAIILGIVQGITEFLPVSSSGHLVVLQKYMGLDSAGDEMILFDLAVHVGTVFAVLFFYRHSLAKYALHLKGSLLSGRSPKELYSRSPSIRISICAIGAIFVTGIFYILAGDWIEQAFDSRTTVAICWLITATLLLVTDQRKHTRKGLRQFGIAAALVIGLAQGMALWPGISRSGSTICVAVLFGLRRHWAAQFSFLIGIPAILAATLLKGTQAIQQGQSAIDWPPILIATVVSALVGIAALGLLIWALKKAKLKYFAIYLYLIGTLTLIF